MKILLGTNWKMHKTVKEAVEYTTELVKIAQQYKDKFQLFIISPYTDLWKVKEITDGSPILFGAQNMHWKDDGAYTGEISPKMLKEIGIDIIELGHSERRQYYNENDYDINLKVNAAIQNNFISLICIGENLVEKNYGISKEVIRKQLKAILKDVKDSDTNNIWIAYEPVWAIGESGIPAEASYAGEIHSEIRSVLVQQYNEEVAKNIPILYGGSVNLDNSLSYMQEKDVDGLFIGRAAWQTESFLRIIEKIDKEYTS